MFRTKYIVCLLVLIPFLSWGSNSKIEGDHRSTSLGIPNYSGSDDGATFHFNHRPYLAAGFRNFMVDYNATIQVKRWFELGAGIGYHHSSVKFYSSSDRHTIGLASIPTYITATVYAYHDDNRAFYLKGNYGIANNLNGPRNTRAKNFSSIMFQAGVGYKFLYDNIDRYVYVELSQYSSTAKGTYKDTDTYNANIDYNLQFYGVVLSVGVNLNRF